MDCSPVLHPVLRLFHATIRHRPLALLHPGQHRLRALKALGGGCGPSVKLALLSGALLAGAGLLGGQLLTKSHPAAGSGEVSGWLTGPLAPVPGPAHSVAQPGFWFNDLGSGPALADRLASPSAIQVPQAPPQPMPEPGSLVPLAAWVVGLLTLRRRYNC